MRYTAVFTSVTVFVFESETDLPFDVLKSTFVMPNVAETVYVAVAKLLAASVTFTVNGPGVRFGTVNVAPLHEPEPFVEVVPDNATAAPLNVALMDFDAANPDPLMLSVVPLYP